MARRSDELVSENFSIPDEKGRVGKYPGRVEAESMQLEGYTPIPVTPWEAASGGMAVSCAISRCAATLRV